MESQNKPAGWGALFSGVNAIRSLTLVGGVALHAINVHIATTILPTVVKDIGGINYYAWNTTLFVAASILGSMLAPRLLGQVGPRFAYLVSAIIFVTGTLICGFAPSMPALLVGRSIQGLGGGFILALSYAMIRIVFDEALWPRAIALVSGMWGVATLIGPAIGGIFAELGVWRAAFWSLSPAIVLFAVLALLVLPKTANTSDDTATIPWAQLILLTAAVLIISAGSVSPLLTINLAGIAVAAILLAGLVAIEQRSNRRVLPKGAFSFGKLGSLYLTIALLSTAVTCGEIFIPLFFQVLHNQSPLVAGYLAAVMGGGWTLGSILSSGISGKRTDTMILTAPVLGIIGMITLAILVPGGSAGTWANLAPLCICLLIIGFGVGLAWPHLLTRVFKNAPKNEQGLASASITTVQLFTTALGAALAGVVANMGGLSNPGGFEGTSNAALWLFYIFSIMPVLALLSTRQVVRLTANGNLRSEESKAAA